MLAQTATDFSIAFPMFMLSTLLFGFIIGTLITVIPFWMICSKAGFPGALALLMLVPIANIILPFYLAFAEWPSLKGPTDPSRASGSNDQPMRQEYMR